MARAGLVFLTLLAAAANAQSPQPPFTPAEKAIDDRIRMLRSLPDSDRPAATKELAIRIRQLPLTPSRQILAIEISNLVTEGDPGHDTLQETANTLAQSLREQPSVLEDPYVELAMLARYEHVDVTLDHPLYRKALAKLAADDERRQHADFTLTALDGKAWTLRQLKGKVVLVNFWATWCPPCRKEMPDLDAIYRQYRAQGLVILAISDEERDKVAPFIAEQKIGYPVLLDPGRKVNDSFAVQGIPKSFVYDRSGRLVAQSIDMRTRGQFLEMLAKAGLKAARN